MVNICLSCQEANDKKSKARKFGQIYNNKKKVTAKWAKNFGFINNTPPIGYKRLRDKKIFNQKNGNEVHLKLGKRFANRYIYVWASLPVEDSLVIKEALNAYNLKTKINDVFGKLDKNGNIKIMIKNPQVYKEGHVYPPHIHYKVSNKEGNDYTNDFFTQTYLGIINYKQMMQHVNSKKYVIINALPSEYFAKYQIPNSVNLPYNKCKKMTTEEIHKFMKDILINYPKIEKSVKSKKMLLRNIPIIVYCAKKSCSAGEILANCLLKHNYVNIIDYKNGLKEYYKKKYNKTLF